MTAGATAHLEPLAPAHRRAQQSDRETAHSSSTLFNSVSPVQQLAQQLRNNSQRYTSVLMPRGPDAVGSSLCPAQEARPLIAAMLGVSNSNTCEL